VLVDNTVRWEGRQRILEPPAPETLKTIKDLVAASTGFNAERGDQLIVESLPFESSLTSEPPRIEGPAPKPKKEIPGPKWLELLQKNRDILLPVALGIGLVLFLIRAVVALLARRGRGRRVESPLELPEADAVLRRQIGSAPADQIASEDDDAAGSKDRQIDLGGKVRELAQKDLDLAANVVKLWLQEEARTT
jgi:flagellar biosynthesis/type III secretory pathway M-ring protein FliF/YscJ